MKVLEKELLRIDSCCNLWAVKCGAPPVVELVA